MMRRLPATIIRTPGRAPTPSVSRPNRSLLGADVTRGSTINSSGSASISSNKSILSTNDTSCWPVTRRLSSLPAPPSNEEFMPQNQDDNLVPIDFMTSSSISGEESQILEVQLRPNQMLRAESGAMLYMTEGVTMETSMGLGGNSGGGFSAGLTRMMTGQNLMVSDFQYTGSSDCGTVGLGTDFPAKILKFDLSEYPDSKLICQKGAFLAGSHAISMEMAYTKNFSSGFFGGEGFILQSLQGTSGNGGETAFLKAYGTVVKRELQQGESLRVAR